MDSKEKATLWLEANNIDQNAKDEINALLQNPDELDEAFLNDLEFGRKPCAPSR